jgi:DNA-binding NtrC family response regulator
MSFKILIAEDEEITLKQLLYALKKEGYEAVGAKNGLEALDLIEREYFDVLITDVKMPGMSGIELLERVKEKYPAIEVLVITGFGSIDSAVEAMKKGAYEYITKPFNLDELILKVRNIHERRNLKKENIALKTFFGMNKGVNIIARSQCMKKILDTVEGIRDSECPVLITGESGVGKSLLAKIIHFTSMRRNMPFLSLNCPALSEELLAGELFGQKEKAVTGAVRVKRGLLEIADSGSLFIDEIWDMPLALQARLLRFLESGEFFREGGEKPVRVNVRIIGAASHDLAGPVSEGRFLEGLYYRLNVMEIFIPPLREHREDIEPLGRYFLQKHLQESNKNITGFAKESVDLLMQYSFPGNVRELENIIERSIILEKGTLITPESLPRSIRMFQIETFPPGRIVTLEELTRDYADKVLELADGDKQRASELLGISEIELWKILKGK